MFRDQGLTPAVSLGADSEDCAEGTKIGAREADNPDAKYAGTKLGLI